MNKETLFIITGASKGLGRALVNELTKDTLVKIIGISRSTLDDNTRYSHLSLDLTNIPKLIESLDFIFPKGNFEKVVLINNAGWIGEIAHNGRLDPISIEKIYQVNVIAPGILMNAFMERYNDFEGEKLVINISSGAANKEMDGWSGYCASKAALNQMTKVAQFESNLHNRGFRLYALSPGIIDTPMQETVRAASEENFSNLSKFHSFKENNELSSASETAKKVIYLSQNHHLHMEVLQDVRQF